MFDPGMTFTLYLGFLYAEERRSRGRMENCGWKRGNRGILGKGTGEKAKQMGKSKIRENTRRRIWN